MNNDFGKDVEWRVPGLHAQHKHLFRLQKDFIYFPQSLVLFSLVAVISYWPNLSQAEIFLIHISQTTLNFVNDVNGLHDIVRDFVQVSFDNGLEWLNVFRLLDDLKNGFPSALQNVTIVYDDLIDRNRQLCLNLRKLTSWEVYPWLQNQQFMVFLSHFLVKNLWMCFYIVQSDRHKGVKQTHRWQSKV